MHTWRYNSDKLPRGTADIKILLLLYLIREENVIEGVAKCREQPQGDKTEDNYSCVRRRDKNTLVDAYTKKILVNCRAGITHKTSKKK